MVLSGILRVLGLLAGLLCSAALAQVPCSVAPGCSIAGGRYLVRAPSGWDGMTPLPVLVFFHGWRESAEYVLADPPVRDFAERHKVLLVAPHGEGNTWSYPGAPGKHRDEFAFVAALTADVKRRFPVDPVRFVAAGFSQGASMVWNIACRMPGAFTAYGALAGGFWEPSPERCAGEGVNLIHVHGTTDATVPMGGRSLRGGVYTQADVNRDWMLWVKENACHVDAKESSALDGRQCRFWTGCGRPRQLAMCLHGGGHNIHPEDMEAVWAFVGRTAGR